VIFVSHRLDEVIRVSDRICVLRNGEVVGERPTSDVNEDDLFHLMTGRHAETQSRDRQSAQSLERVVLEVEHLSSWHMFWHKFKDISFQVRSGEVHAFLGTNNSGREDVCRAIFGAEGYDTGSVRYKGQPLPKNGLRSNVYEGIGYIPAERKLEGMVAGMTVSENMVLTHPGASATGPFINEAGRRQIATEWIGKLSIRPPNAEADIAALSGGNQQKVVLAKWLEDPKLALLILDHPTRGIDPGAREDVTKQILLACAKGAGVLLIADTLEEAMAIADTITVMRDGQITARYDLRSGSIPSYEDLVGHMV
jgi:ribose transport system ATP-binding protein